MQNIKENLSIITLQEEPLTLDQLNDDCLECIFERLTELPSQLQAARVCRRFRAINLHIWRREPANLTLCLEEWRERLPEECDLEYFLHAMSDSLREIKIIDECLSAFLKDLEDMGIDRLPNVERFELQEILDCYPHDEDIRTLTQMLPNLKYLHITMPISGRYIADFKELEELHLYEDQEKVFEIKNEYLEEICMNLRKLRVLDIRTYEMSNLCLSPHITQCEQLQVLKLNLNALRPVLNEVLNLPKLRRLTVLLDQVIDVSRILNVDTHDYKIYETFEFFEILKRKSDCIIGLAVDNYYMPLAQHWDVDLPFLEKRKLRKFAFCNCEFFPDMLEKYTSMPQLRLLCCRNWPCLTNAMVLLFIESCPELVHLDITYCKNLDKNLLYDALAILQHQKRSNPLNIYYLLSGVENEVEEVNPKFWSTQNVIALSTDFPPDSERGLSYVQRGFEFEFE